MSQVPFFLFVCEDLWLALNSLGQNKMADIEKEEVLVRLRKISMVQLEEICGTLQLTVGDQKKCKQKAMLNAVHRMLSSEEIEDSDDEGLEVFHNLNEQLKKMLGEHAITKPVSVKTETGGVDDGSTSSSHEEKKLKPSEQNYSGNTFPSSTTTSTLDLKRIKIRDFKISNGAVGVEKGNVKWGSLCFQMKQGLSQGYGERDIMLGVIGAMKEGSSEQIFFQLSMDDPSLTHEIFMGMLRSLYGVKDSNTLMDEIKESVHEPTETLKKYVMRMSGYRKQIMQVTEHEDCPVAEATVKKRYIHSLLVGLRDPTTRLELKPILQSSMPDHELMAVVNEMTAREEEYEKKMGKKSVAGLKAVDVGAEGDYSTREEGKYLA